MHLQAQQRLQEEGCVVDITEYGAIDAMEPLPQETVVRELDMEAAADIDEHQS